MSIIKNWSPSSARPRRGLCQRVGLPRMSRDPQRGRKTFRRSPARKTEQDASKNCRLHGRARRGQERRSAWPGILMVVATKCCGTLPFRREGSSPSPASSCALMMFEYKYVESLN